MTNHNRQSIIALGEMAHIQESLIARATYEQESGLGFDLFKPIRETPLDVFFDKSEGSMADGRLNPNLSTIWKSRYGMRIGDMAKGNAKFNNRALKETVSVPNSLSALKIADEILEGAEPWSDWKQYSRLIDMETPKINVPLTKYTDTVSSSNSAGLDMYKEAGGAPPPIGGKVTTLELDCSGTNNSFRGTIAMGRNDVKDNNFLAVEQSLKNAGNEFYYMIGEKIIDTIIAGVTNTAARTTLDNATTTQPFVEALVNVIRGKFPGDQRNRADTMFIHPEDAALAVSTGSGVGGTFSLLNRIELGPTDDTDVVNNSGLAAALGLRAVWETPQMTKDTVLITKRDIASVVGLREDLTIENFDLSVGGLYESDLLVRIDVQSAFDTGSFTITNWDGS